MARRFPLAVTFAVLVFTAVQSFAQPRPGLVLDPETYGNRWAVIVGIDYDGQAGMPNSVARLKFAENDAKAVRDLLVANYGYSPENTVLLLGEAAKKADIERALTTLWSSKVAKDDSVLFFFSGHGYERRGTNSTRGQLMPADIRYDGGQPTIDSVLELDSIVDHFNQDCPAKHKLLVLDCCYSATVFSEYTHGRPAKVLEGGSEDQSLFNEPAFQAMVASRANAQDGFNGHSPFTGALLKSLQYMPRRRPQGSAIRTTELFAQMKLFFADYLGRGQSPSCSWLNNDQGEFHFFPDPTSKFPDPEVPDDEIRKMMVAMVPGSFGNWWFSETPWFMPGLRYSILEKDVENRSADMQLITPDRLREAADKLQERMSDNLDERFQARMAHLKMMLSAQGEEAKAVVARIAADLKKEASKPDADPLDVHYLAVLQHGAGLGEQAESQKTYDLAIELYEKRLETENSVKPMLALCYSDRGWYRYEVQYDYEKARNDFMKARSIYGQETPAPFLIYVLCREADALSRLGHTGAVVRRLNDVQGLVKDSDPSELHPISAAYYHRRGWIEMDWCDFKSAAENFAKSNEILQKESAGFGIDGTILRLHNYHGEAMAIRYSGDRETAMYKYRSLQQEITSHFGKLRDDAENISNFRQVRARIAERWVNTLERSGDCSLFGQPTDAGEAADDYRRAIRAATYLPIEQRKRWEQRLRYKYALALALPDTGVQDLELAEEQFKIIQAINQNSVVAAVHKTSTVIPPASGESADENATPNLEIATDSDSAAGDSSRVAAAGPARSEVPPLMSGPSDVSQDLGIAICRSLTRLLILYCHIQEDCGGGQSCEEKISLAEDTDIFRLQLQKVLEDNRLNPSLRRDELEAAMFCMKVLISALPNPATDGDPKLAKQGRITRQNDIDLLLGYCRMARPKSRKPGAAMQTVAFLRPYYDCAMEALIELKPNHSKQLIEIAHEARHGKSHYKSDQSEATLVLYCTPQQSYFFLDVPRSTSAYYLLPAGLEMDMLKSSSVSGLASRYKLPPALSKELLLLSNHTSVPDGTTGAGAMPVRICWDDPLRGLHARAMSPIAPLAQTSTATVAAKPIVQENFPFQLPLILNWVAEESAPVLPAEDMQLTSSPTISSSQPPTVE